MLILIVAGGPDKGRIYELSEEQPVVIGREGEPITLNDRKASRKHARLWSEGGKWYVRDLHSRHGTHLNARPIDNKSELTDGDHLQIGQTLFVLARVPAEQAERLALLGDAMGKGAATPPLPTDTVVARVDGRPKLLYAGAAAAAALLLASNGLIYWSSTQNAERLRSDIAAARSATTDSAREVIAKVEQPDAAPAEETTQLLRQVLAAVESQTAGEAALAEVKAALAKLPSADALAEGVATKLAAQLDAAGTPEEVALAVKAAISEQTALSNEQMDLLASRLDAPAAASDELLGKILARLEAQPDPTAMLKDVLAKLETEPAESEMLEVILARLDAQPQTGALLEEVRTLADAARKQQEALAARATETDELLRATLEEVKAQPAAEQIAKAVREAAQKAQDGNAVLLEQVLANLAEQQELAQEITELRQLVATQPEATRSAVQDIVRSLEPEDDEAVLAAIGDLRAALPTEAIARLDQVLAKLDAQATPADFAGAVKTVLEDRLAASDAKLDGLAAKVDAQAASGQQLLAALEEATDSPDASLLERVDALASRLEAMTRGGAPEEADTQKLLGEVLAEVRNRQPLEELKAQVAALADAGEDGAAAEKLDAILAAVEGGQTDARLAEIRDLIKAWPGETEAMLSEALAAVTASPQQPSDPGVDAVLRDIRARAMARIDELNAAIRHDLSRELAAVPAASPQPAARAGAATPATRPGRSVLATPGIGETVEASAVEPELTPTEQAYKVAYETGQPVTIGAGMVNASTGAVAEGRTLDPAAARAAGIKHWREWYLMDYWAEKARLQNQQLRFQDELIARGGTLKLPETTGVTINAMPQPGADAGEAVVND